MKRFIGNTVGTILFVSGLMMAGSEQVDFWLQIFMCVSGIFTLGISAVFLIIINSGR